MATYEEKLEYLKSYAIVNRDIAILEMRLQKEPINAQQYSDLPGGTCVGDPVGNLVVSSLEAVRRLPGLRKHRDAVVATIEAVENPLYRQLLTCRFLDGMSHPETAKLLHVSLSVVTHSQRLAICSIKL